MQENALSQAFNLASRALGPQHNLMSQMQPQNLMQFPYFNGGGNGSGGNGGVCNRLFPALV